jgi:hypothetical protein
MTAISLRDMAHLLNDRDVKTAFGGRVFNHISGLSSRIPAHFLGNTIEVAISMIESLITNLVSTPKGEVADKKLLQTASEFREKRPMIEREISNYLTSHNQRIDYLDIANQFLGNILAAALELGDISYASTDLHWIGNLLTERNVSLSVLPLFLNLYAQAIRETMNEDGKVLYDWLMMEAQKLDL